ncbi:MAG: hypothetical protein RLZZ199_1170, partial [Actinomycetota bacterium]
TGLGLSIVRTLVTTELGGTITMRRATPDDHGPDDAGDQKVDATAGPGTVIELRVPLSA